MNIVLDLDDTLYLESDYVKSGFKSIDLWLTAELSITGFYELAWNQFTQGDRANLIHRIFESLNLTKQQADQALKLYREHSPNIALCIDAKNFLQQASQQYKLFMITDGKPEGQWAKIKALNLEPYFEKFFVTGDLGEAYYKPNPFCFKQISSINAEPCIYIGDNPKKDFIAPLALGWLPSIRILRRGSLHENIITPGGCHQISLLTEAWDLLS